MTEKDIEYKLKERHIARSMLCGLPLWMKRFCLLITDFIEFESVELPKELAATSNSMDADNEAYGVKEQRKQNLAVTMDKMAYILRNQSSDKKRAQPPIYKLSEQEMLDRVWNDENSLVHVLLRCLRFHVPIGSEQQDLNGPVVAEIEHLILSQNKIENDLDLMKRLLLRIRDRLRECTPTESAYFDAAADLMHLWANTKWLFGHNVYDSIKSRPFSLEELGFNAMQNPSMRKLMNMKCQKQYGPLYIWGQMHFWFKQTVEKPGTSLCHSRRGCLYLPFIDCCFAKKRNGGILKNYDRSSFIDSLTNNGHQCWSTSLHWTFKGAIGGEKTYGSPFLDHYLDDTIDLNQILKYFKMWTY